MENCWQANGNRIFTEWLATKSGVQTVSTYQIIEPVTAFESRIFVFALFRWIHRPEVGHLYVQWYTSQSEQTKSYIQPIIPLGLCKYSVTVFVLFLCVHYCLKWCSSDTDSTTNELVSSSLYGNDPNDLNRQHSVRFYLSEYELMQ